MEVNVTRKDIRAIANYMENGGLVGHMNNAVCHSVQWCSFLLLSSRNVVESWMK